MISRHEDEQAEGDVDRRVHHAVREGDEEAEHARDAARIEYLDQAADCGEATEKGERARERAERVGADHRERVDRGIVDDIRDAQEHHDEDDAHHEGVAHAREEHRAA